MFTVLISERFSRELRTFCLLVLLGTQGIFQIGIAKAQVPSASERGAAALGHYARARAMLVEALAEFEKGKQLAKPDLLIDSQQWRKEVISRAEELNRLLDPHPRVSKSGVQFNANSRLIRTEKDKYYGVSSSNAKPELTQKSQSDHQVAKQIENIANTENQNLPKATEPEEKQDQAKTVSQPKQNIEIDQATTEEVKAAEQIEQSQGEKNDIGAEDPEITKAIEDAIKQRVEKLEADKNNSAAKEGVGDGLR